MSKRNVRLLLEDMLDACHKIFQYTASMNYDGFVDDTRTFDAVIRNFEIIGEAASLLPDEYEKRYPEIDWHRIVGLRNRLIHGYFGVDPALYGISFRMIYPPSQIQSTTYLTSNRKVS